MAKKSRSQTPVTDPALHPREAKPAETKAVRKGRPDPSGQSINEATAPSWDRFADTFEGLVDPDSGEPTDLPTLAAEYLTLNQTTTEGEKRKKALRDLLKPRIDITGEKLISGEFFVVERVTSHTNRSLSAQKLLDWGVTFPDIPEGLTPMDIINECYDGGVEYSYLTFRVRS